MRLVCNLAVLSGTKPDLKVEISVGGWETPTDYYILAEDETKRTSFINSSIQFLTKHGLDGLHLHWGNPSMKARASGVSTNRSHLTSLLRDLKKAFRTANFTVSLGVWSPIVSKLDNNFDLAEIYKHVDLVFINAYHYHGSWEKRTGAFAPIYASSSTTLSDYKYLTVDATWKYMKKRGAIPCKTVLIIAPKGSGFLLANSTNHGIDEKTVPGKFGEIGVKPFFNQICKANQTGLWTEEWDDEWKAPFMYKGDEWVSFENRRSVEDKVDYANSEKMGGVAVNTLHMDDYLGECFGVQYPILRRIHGRHRAGLCSGAAWATLHAGVFLTIVIMNHMAI